MPQNTASTQHGTPAPPPRANRGIFMVGQYLRETMLRDGFDR